MVDMAAVVGFAQSIRAALDITKAMKDVNDANVIQTKTFELTREIMAAQSYAMEAVAAQSALIDRIRELEASWQALKHGNVKRTATSLSGTNPACSSTT